MSHSATMLALGESLRALDVGARALDGGWVVDVPSTARGHVRVVLVAHERTVRLRAFVMRVPDREHAEVYRRLLHKQMEPSVWRYAVDGSGDVFIACELDRPTTETLDRALGAAAGTVDDVYDGLVRVGFGT